MRSCFMFIYMFMFTWFLHTCGPPHSNHPFRPPSFGGFGGLDHMERMERTLVEWTRQYKTTVAHFQITPKRNRVYYKRP